MSPYQQALLPYALGTLEPQTPPSPCTTLDVQVSQLLLHRNQKDFQHKPVALLSKISSSLEGGSELGHDTTTEWAIAKPPLPWQITLVCASGVYPAFLVNYNLQTHLGRRLIHKHPHLVTQSGTPLASPVADRVVGLLSTALPEWKQQLLQPSSPWDGNCRSYSRKFPDM